MPSTTTAATLVLAATLGAAHAQTPVWRCGDSYTDRPCPDGQALATPRSPTALEQRSAAESTRRAAQTADTLERDRLRTEAQAGRTPTLYLAPVPAGAAAPESPRSPERGTRKLDLFTATVPGSRPDKHGPKAAPASQKAAAAPVASGKVQPAPKEAPKR